MLLVRSVLLLSWFTVGSAFVPTDFWCYGICKAPSEAFYKRVKYKGAWASCSFACNPGAHLYGGCYKMERFGEQCLDFRKAKEGICYRGQCISNGSTIEELLRGQPKQGGQCAGGWHFLYHEIRRIHYGCLYYCKERPFNIAWTEDGIRCLDPETAIRMKCDEEGYCVRPLKPKPKRKKG